MKIEIKEQNYKQLIQCVYLGNLIINEYRKVGEGKEEYENFLNSLLIQIVKTTPKQQAKLQLNAMPYEKNQDNMLSDLLDRIEDSVKDYYKEFKRALLEEIIVNKLLDD